MSRPAFYYDDEPPTVVLPAIESHAPTPPQGEAPRKACDRCGDASYTHDEFCPHCAARYSGVAAWQRKLRAFLLWFLIIGLIIAGVAMMVGYNNAMAAVGVDGMAPGGSAASTTQHQPTTTTVGVP